MCCDGYCSRELCRYCGIRIREFIGLCIDIAKCGQRFDFRRDDHSAIFCTVNCGLARGKNFSYGESGSQFSGVADIASIRNQERSDDRHGERRRHAIRIGSFCVSRRFGNV